METSSIGIHSWYHNSCYYNYIHYGQCTRLGTMIVNLSPNSLMQILHKAVSSWRMGSKLSNIFRTDSLLFVAVNDWFSTGWITVEKRQAGVNSCWSENVLFDFYHTVLGYLNNVAVVEYYALPNTIAGYSRLMRIWSDNHLFCV